MAPVDLEEAVGLLREKLGQRTFVKAVGRRTAEAIEALLRAVECGAVVGEEEAARLLNDFYIFQSRVRRLLEVYDSLSRGALRAVAREIWGTDLEPVDYQGLLRELEAYGEALRELGRRARCLHSWSSRA